MLAIITARQEIITEMRAHLDFVFLPNIFFASLSSLTLYYMKPLLTLKLLSTEVSSFILILSEKKQCCKKIMKFQIKLNIMTTERFV